MTEPEKHLARSAARLLKLFQLDAPRTVVDNEIRILTIKMSGVVGPEKVRGWADEATDRFLASLSETK